VRRHLKPSYGGQAVSVKIMETANLIHYLEIVDREIAIEGIEQKASICHVIKHHIPNFIEDLRELNEYRKKYGKLVLDNGKAFAGTTEVTDTLHLPRHQTMQMRLIPD
jgi:hypothetical protein